MTKLRDIYARDGLTFSIEFFPPKTPEGMDSLFAELQELKKLDPAFVSVTYGAGGTTAVQDAAGRQGDEVPREARGHVPRDDRQPARSRT